MTTDTQPLTALINAELDRCGCTACECPTCATLVEARTEIATHRAAREQAETALVDLAAEVQMFAASGRSTMGGGAHIGHEQSGAAVSVVKALWTAREQAERERDDLARDLEEYRAAVERLAREATEHKLDAEQAAADLAGARRGADELARDLSVAIDERQATETALRQAQSTIADLQHEQSSGRAVHVDGQRYTPDDVRTLVLARSLVAEERDRAEEQVRQAQAELDDARHDRDDERRFHADTKGDLGDAWAAVHPDGRRGYALGTTLAAAIGDLRAARREAQAERDAALRAGRVEVLHAIVEFAESFGADAVVAFVGGMLKQATGKPTPPPTATSEETSR